MLSFQWKDQFYIGGQLENAVVTLTYRDYNGNYSLVENSVNSILNALFDSVQFKIIIYVFCARRHLCQGHLRIISVYYVCGSFLLWLELNLQTILP